MRLFLIGALGFVSACSMTGWGGDSGSDPAYAVRTKGWQSNRVLTDTQAGLIDSNGAITSYTATASWRGRAAPRSVKGAVRAYQITRSPNDHGGFDPGYSQVGIADGAGKGNGAGSEESASNDDGTGLLTHETRDTNRDGFISGGGGCGIAVLDEWMSSIPPSAIWQDVTTCVKGRGVGDFSIGSTQGAATGGGFAYVNNAEEGDAENALFDRLPFDARIQLLNSVNTLRDVAAVKLSDGKGPAIEQVTVRLTGLRIGNATYAPQGVTAQIIAMRNLKIDMRTPGAKLMFAWIADQAQAALDNGAKQLSGSITVNDAVTFTTEQMPKNMKLLDLNKGFVSHFRAMAAN